MLAKTAAPYFRLAWFQYFDLYCSTDSASNEFDNLIWTAAPICKDIMASSANNETPGPKPIRILFLHGFTQNSQLFRAKTGALTKALQKAFSAPKYDLKLCK